jgi:DNA-directed RNA polymerase subunit H (RpoH/RPB5)
MSDISTLFKLFKNVVEMMKTRGYDTHRFEKILTRDLYYFNDVYTHSEKKNSVQKILMSDKIGKTGLRGLLSYDFKHLDGKNRCLVFFAELGNSKSISKGEAQIFGLLFKEKKCNNGIIISSVDLSPSAKQEVMALESSSNYHIDFFLDKDIMYNPLVCDLGSRIKVRSDDPDEEDYDEYGIEILTGEDEETFLSENRILKEQLPRIASEDPVAKYYGLRHGQIIRCIRKAVIPETLINEEIFYRLVVKKKLDKAKPRKIKI